MPAVWGSEPPAYAACGEGSGTQGGGKAGRQPLSPLAWQAAGTVAQERLSPAASRWEGGHEEQRVGQAMAPHPGSCSQTSQALPPPREANTGSPLKLLQSELIRNSLQHQPSAGLRKPHFSPKLTLSQAEQGSCLPRLHDEGKYPWNLLFT